MRIWLRCLLASFALTCAAIAWILFVPLGSDVAFAFVSPSFWLTHALFGSILQTSTGPNNFIVTRLASALFNVALYAAVFFLLFRISRLIRRKPSADPSL